jgi:hypothetical protein
MSQVIGVTGSSTTSHSQARITSDTPYAVVIDQNQQINNILVYPLSGTTSITCDVALYDVTGVTTDFSSAPRVLFLSQVTFDVPVGGHLGINGGLPIDISALSGKKVAITANNVTAGILGNIASFYTNASRSGGDAVSLPDPWGYSTATAQAVCIYATTETALSGPSITAADDITAEGQTATFTLSGNTEAPTGATLNGTDVGTLTDVGSGVYSYTAPLIADDAAATLSVSVDGTTADTTISYANSLPYALTAHAEPDANSVMFGNQFATTGAVELADPVLVSGDAGAATIDWAAMDAAQGWTADINTYATANEDGTQTWEFTYLIAETNQTGTFQRTFTVGDGVIVVTGGGRRVGVRPSIRSAIRPAISSAIHEG